MGEGTDAEREGERAGDCGAGATEGGDPDEGEPGSADEGPGKVPKVFGRITSPYSCQSTRSCTFPPRLLMQSVERFKCCT